MVHLAVLFERMRYQGVTKAKSDLIILPTKTQYESVSVISEEKRYGCLKAVPFHQRLNTELCEIGCGFTLAWFRCAALAQTRAHDHHNRERQIPSFDMPLE